MVEMSRKLRTDITRQELLHQPPLELHVDRCLGSHTIPGRPTIFRMMQATSAKIAPGSVSNLTTFRIAANNLVIALIRGPQVPHIAAMVVKIRLARFGRRNQPFYNIVIAHARSVSP